MWVTDEMIEKLWEAINRRVLEEGRVLHKDSFFEEVKAAWTMGLQADHAYKFREENARWMIGEHVYRSQVLDERYRTELPKLPWDDKSFPTVIDGLHPASSISPQNTGGRVNFGEAPHRHDGPAPESLSDTIVRILRSAKRMNV